MSKKAKNKTLIIQKPKKRIKPVARDRVIKKAHYQKHETDKTREVVVFTQEGKREVRYEPVYNTVYVPPVVQKVIEQQEVWDVVTECKGVQETHEFANEEMAKGFCRGIS